MPDATPATDPKLIDDTGAPRDAKDVSPDATSAKKPQSDNQRLDEGLEETFPASDPVSAKHIT